MRNLLKNDAAIADMIGGVLAVLVGCIVAVVIWFKVDGALAASTTFTSLPSGARAAWNSTNTTANTTLTLMPVVAIILIAAIILAVVNAFGQPGT